MQEIRHVGRLFRIAEHAIAQEVHKNHEALGITSSQGYMLGYLTRRYLEGDVPIYAKDAEQHFGVKHSSVSGVLQRLECKGFITFQPDDTDRRCKKIVLTKKALDIHSEIEKHIRKTETRIFDGMTDEETDTFLRLLRKATENLTGGNVDCPPPLSKEDA